MTSFVIQLLGQHHDRREFRCGEESLDRYLRDQAGQDARRRLARCFVVSRSFDDAAIAGYYTLSAAEIRADELPEDAKHRLPRYSAFPSALIGRLAVDRHFRGLGLGAAMIYDAIERADRAELAIFALLVDAKNDAAVSFYRRLGFQQFSSNPRSLFLQIGKRP